MSGFFGSISKRDCVTDVFYGTDYHSHLGTKRAGMAFSPLKKVFNVPFTAWKMATSAINSKPILKSLMATVALV